MKNEFRTRQFGEILKDIVVNSGMSSEDFSNSVNKRMINTSQDSEIAPSISTLNAVLEVGQPVLEQEMELFRAIVPLMLLDQSRPLAEILYASRKGYNLSLSVLGKTFQSNLDEHIDCDPELIIPLAELGYRTPKENEMEIIAELFFIEDVEMLYKKSRSQDNIKVVDGSFKLDDIRLTPEKILKARQVFENEENAQQQQIISAAAKLLLDRKRMQLDDT